MLVSHHQRARKNNDRNCRERRESGQEPSPHSDRAVRGRSTSRRAGESKSKQGVHGRLPVTGRKPIGCDVETPKAASAWSPTRYETRAQVTRRVAESTTRLRLGRSGSPAPGACDQTRVSRWPRWHQRQGRARGKRQDVVSIAVRKLKEVAKGAPDPDEKRIRSAIQRNPARCFPRDREVDDVQYEPHRHRRRRTRREPASAAGAGLLEQTQRALEARTEPFPWRRPRAQAPAHRVRVRA